MAHSPSHQLLKSKLIRWWGGVIFNQRATLSLAHLLNHSRHIVGMIARQQFSTPPINEPSKL